MFESCIIRLMMFAVHYIPSGNSFFNEDTPYNTPRCNMNNGN